MDIHFLDYQNQLGYNIYKKKTYRFQKDKLYSVLDISGVVIIF